MTDAILTLNIGSSSVKASLRGADADRAIPLWSASVESIGNAAHLKINSEKERAAPEISSHKTAVAWAIAAARRESDQRRIAAVGHRIVHGGAKYSEAIAIDDAVFAHLRALAPLAPGHQPHNLMGVEAARAALPGALEVACFDTAFHRAMPTVEKLFALPRRYTDAGVIRYGFHGLSYAYVASALPQVLGPRADGRVIVGHLGSGASLCAMRDKKSVATTMGFTALDGLPMATRCGSIDPGVLLHLLQQEGMDATALSELLHNESGLLGVSGLSGDMRALLESDDPRAGEAIDLFVYRAAREIGALAATMGGLDAIVFTGGVGENAAPVRARICERAAWLGLTLDAAANDAGAMRISAPSSRVSAWVIATDEEREIARQTRKLLATT